MTPLTVRNQVQMVSRLSRAFVSLALSFVNCTFAHQPAHQKPSTFMIQSPASAS